jgi:hypothetical protein
VSRTPAARTRVYGPLRGWGGGVLLSPLVRAAALFWAGRAGASRSQLDCARPAEARRLIGLLTLAEIEGAEDIHRAATWDALGRCPAGAAGEPCRDGVRRRSATAWQRQKRQIEAKYRTMLAEFEQRCFASITRRDGRPRRAAG